MIRLSWFLIIALVLGCTTESPPIERTYGERPELQAPETTLIPTVNIAPENRWDDDSGPVVADGFTVTAFARDLDHPRWLYALPNGDILVAESNAPTRPDDNKGLRGWFTKKVMARAGAGVPSANRISLLRDSDGDGVAEVRSAFLENLNSPFGIYLRGDPVVFEGAGLFTARWIEYDDQKTFEKFKGENEGYLASDHTKTPVFLARNAWHLETTEKDWPALRFMKTKEQ
jgi:glucose/arabinose dehydrogenase